jgi:hypothetical protein
LAGVITESIAIALKAGLDAKGNSKNFILKDFDDKAIADQSAQTFADIARTNIEALFPLC